MGKYEFLLTLITVIILFFWIFYWEIQLEKSRKEREKRLNKLIYEAQMLIELINEKTKINKK